MRAGGAAAFAVGMPGFKARAGKAPMASPPDLESILADKEAARRAIEDQCRAVFEKNYLEWNGRRFHVPSEAGYRSFFAWDSGWHVIGLMHLDPEAAMRELQAIYAFQAEDGRVPHEARIPGVADKHLSRRATIWMVRKQYDEAGSSMFIDPPSYLLAAGLLYKKTGDERVLDLVPAMERSAEFFLPGRDLFGDGLASIVHPWESGTDSAPIFDGPIGTDPSDPSFEIDYALSYLKLLSRLDRLGWDMERVKKENAFAMEDVGLNSILAAGLIELSDLLEARGDGEGAAKWRARARSLVQAMEETLWDESAGFFYPRYDLERKLKSNRTCLTGLLPLITGMIGEDKAERMIDEKLLSADHFNSPWLVPFNSVSEIEGEKLPLAETMLWRGRCIWANMNWLAARGAAKYGRPDLARKITRHAAALILTSGMREFYDPSTGEGMGTKDFNWPALCLDLIDEHGL